ncbi:MAG: hypothetical protein JNL01_00600 [Bdellovibrionales bacterium]|nr:hypothetical protein [Bdellovibrionales bacterium]
MKSKQAALAVWTLAWVGQIGSAHAYVNNCTTRSENDVTSLCAGRTLPKSQVRNKKSQQLECTGNVDSYIRHPQTDLPFDKWRAALGHKDGQMEAYRLKRETLPLIQWTGQIPYQTIETWQYETCDLVTDSFKCGTHQECHNETRTVTTYDDKGNANGSKQVTEEVCVSVPNTCWADITHSESLFCSNETMTFAANYVRPSESEWNPSTPGYYDVLPNKYDLLPGEMEVVQVYSNGSGSTTIHPSVVIGDAWNKYKPVFTGSAVGAACRQNTNYHFDLAIHTVGRDVGKASPNAFRLPKDYKGNAVDPLEWGGGVDPVKDQAVSIAVPRLLKLDDTSGATMDLLSEQSRKNADREALKAQEGMNIDKEDAKNAIAANEAKNQGFWKNTKVKVELIRQRKAWWDSFWSEMYVTEVDAKAPTLNFLAEDETTKQSDFWEIDIGKVGGLYETVDGKNNYLKPNRHYKLKISMYQPGVDFYQQSCDDKPDQSWRCGWASWITKYRESEYYSKPIEIQFKSPENFDGRNGKYWRRSWVKNAPDNLWVFLFGDVEDEKPTQ